MFIICVGLNNNPFALVCVALKALKSQSTQINNVAKRIKYPSLNIYYTGNNLRYLVNL